MAPYIKVHKTGTWVDIDVLGLGVHKTGTWVPADGYVHATGTWRQFHVKSDPIVYTVWFGGSGWSQVYRGTSGVTSNRTNGDDLCYWGFSWNTEIERSMVSMDDRSAAVAAAILRPTVTSAVVKTWVGHVFAGTDNVYLGIADETSKPSTFQRNHSEKSTNWGQKVTLTKPGSGSGALDTQTMNLATAQNWWTALAIGNFGSMTFSAEDATDANDLWGWSSGRQYSTGNSGGSASGLTDLPAENNKGTRIEFTVDYA